MENETQNDQIAVIGIIGLTVFCSILATVISLLNNNTIYALQTRTTQLEQLVQAQNAKINELEVALKADKMGDGNFKGLIGQLKNVTENTLVSAQRLIQQASKPEMSLKDEIMLWVNEQNRKISELTAQLHTVFKETTASIKGLHEQSTQLEQTFVILASAQDDKLKELNAELLALIEKIEQQRINREETAHQDNIVLLSLDKETKNMQSLFNTLLTKVATLKTEISVSTQEYQKQLEQQALKYSTVDTGLTDDITLIISLQDAKVKEFKTQLTQLQDHMTRFEQKLLKLETNSAE